MNLQQQVRFYLEDIDTAIGKSVNLIITGLVLLSSAIFIAETYPIPVLLRIQLNLLNQFILVVFTIEYAFRLWSAENKPRYFFSLYALIDLLAILPFLFTTIDIRFIRIFRWFRILRLIRYVEGKTIFGYVSREDSAIFARILFTLFTIIFIFSGLIYQAEHFVNPEKYSTFLDAVYFSVVTMATVGFGDITPVSQVGRLLTVSMILTGIALIPWQVGELIKQLLKTSNRSVLSILCTNCGLASHDADAKFCKICGKLLARVGSACELPLQDLSEFRTEIENST
ncbi:MAG: ion transporter [Cyanobacteria bacterium CRU_2_1]|nr:ion transporter [Cyanobacteria bacterium RU_5_0]NJR62051.1 ion transporter [Cyanobacteria bacterium CRU_2_1]